MGEAAHQGLQPLPALHEGQGAQILAALRQQVIGAQVRRIGGDEFRRHGLAVQPLLQDVEALHPPLAHDQQFPVECRVGVERVRDVRERRRDVVAGAGIEPRDSPPVGPDSGGSLDADAVPFPLRHERGGVEGAEIIVLDRVRQHRRPERGGIAGRWSWPSPLDPGEELGIGR